MAAAAARTCIASSPAARAGGGGDGGRNRGISGTSSGDFLWDFLWGLLGHFRGVFFRASVADDEVAGAFRREERHRDAARLRVAARERGAAARSRPVSAMW